MSQMMNFMKEHQVRMSVVQQQNPFSTANSSSQDTFTTQSINDQEAKQKITELETRNTDLLNTNSDMSKQIVSLQKKIE